VSEVACTDFTDKENTGVLGGPAYEGAAHVVEMNRFNVLRGPTDDGKGADET
jgi:hypothetical protein